MTFAVTGRNPIRVQWPIQPIPEWFYRALVARFWSMNTYGHMRESEMKQILREVVRSKDDSDAPVPLSMDAAFSIYHLAIKAKIMSGYGRMNRTAPQLARLYESGVDILIISARFDFPPLNLLRGVLIHRLSEGRADYTKRQLYDVFADNAPADSVLRGRDLAQFRKAAQNDADSVIDQRRIAEVAQANEDVFVDWVREWHSGFKIRTQEDLAAEQVAQYGRAILTPDVLFDEPVMINGREINWIDFKSFVGCDIQFIAQSNKKQSDKYTAEWGPGAMCYQLGVVEGLNVGAAVLTCAELDIKFDNSLYR